MYFTTPNACQVEDDAVCCKRYNNEQCFLRFFKRQKWVMLSDFYLSPCWVGAFEIVFI